MQDADRLSGLFGISQIESLIKELDNKFSEISYDDPHYITYREMREKLSRIWDALIKAEREKTANLAPEIRYLKDPYFKQLVDMMESYLHLAQFTPTELREAAMLAAIKYDMESPSRLIMKVDNMLKG